MKPEWKELWRPFLESEPVKLLGIQDIIFQAIHLSVPHSSCDEEHEIHETKLRGLKLFAHLCKDSSFPDLILSRHPILISFVVETANDEESTLRCTALDCLASFCLHEEFFQWLMQEDQAILASKISNTSLKRLQDPSMGVSESAVEFLCRWISAPVLNAERFTEWNAEILCKYALGEQIHDLLEKTSQLDVQITLVHLTIELCCQSVRQPDESLHQEHIPISLVREYDRGRAFSSRYHLARGCIYHVIADARLLRFRVVEMIEYFSEHDLVYLFLEKEILDPSSALQQIELEFVSLLQQLVSAKKQLKPKDISLIILQAHLASAIRFSSHHSRECLLKEFYLPAFGTCLGLLFNEPTKSIFTAHQVLRLEPKSKIANSIRDVTALCSRILEGFSKLLENHTLDQNSFSFSEKRQEIPSGSPWSENHWSIWLENQFSSQFLEVILNILSHPLLGNSSGILLSGFKVISELLTFSWTHPSWILALHRYDPSSELLSRSDLMMDSDSKGTDLFEALLGIVRHARTPASALSPAYDLIVNLIKHISFTQEGSKLLFEKLGEVCKLQLCHPDWENIDGVFQMFKCLFATKNPGVISQCVAHGFPEFLLEKLDHSSGFVRAAALEAISTFITSCDTAVDLLEPLVSSMENSLILSPLRKSFPDCQLKNLSSVLLCMMFDPDEIPCRQAVEVFVQTLSSIPFYFQFTSTIQDSPEFKTFARTAFKHAITNIDWEVKQRSIQFFAILWRENELEETLIRNLKLFTEICGPDLILLATNDCDRIPRLESFNTLIFIQQRIRELESQSNFDWTQFELAEFVNNIRNVDYHVLANQCTQEAVYPDETDLRLAASEIQNPVGCY